MSFPHVPCLWARPKIPVKSPCGLFPRTFLVRSLFRGRAPGFYSLSQSQSAHSQALHHQRHCQTKRDAGMAQRPQMRRSPGSAPFKYKNAFSHLHCAGHCAYRKYTFTLKSHLMFYNLEMGVNSLKKCFSITKKKLKTTVWGGNNEGLNNSNSGVPKPKPLP